ncbi:ATP binding protein [Aureococcus anophagefferens]|nr:ATP binding protein [Aureococcus anophagefferens]
MSDSSDGEEDAPPKDFAALFGRAPSANSTCAGAGEEFFAAAVEEPARAGGAAPAGLALNPGASPDDARFLDGDLSRHLKPHQERGVRFMWERCVGPAEEGDARGCVLADHMGLGKTLQLICVLKSWLGGGPPRRTALVIAPAFVLSNWLGEIERWLPRDRALRRDAARGRAARRARAVASGRVRRRALRPGAGLLVLDEAHRLKEPRSQLYKAMGRIRTRRRVLASGYPVQNRLDEYWALVTFARPAALGSYDRFRAFFERPIVDYLEGAAGDAGADGDGNHDGATALRRAYRALYDAFEQSAGLFTAEADAGEVAAPRGELAAYHTALAIVNHPDIVHGALAEEERLFDDGGDDDGAADALAGDAGHAAVLERLIDASNAAADSGAKLRYARIDGATPAAQRSAIVDDFNAPPPPTLATPRRWRREEATAAPPAGLRARREEAAAAAAGARGDAAAAGGRLGGGGDGCDVLLMSIKAGGEGINLTGANRVVLFDVCWNPCFDRQAMCRAHRFGQKRPVFVYRLVAPRGTMEAKVLRQQRRKELLVREVVERQAPSDARFALRPVFGPARRAAGGGRADPLLRDVVDALGADHVAAVHEDPLPTLGRGAAPAEPGAAALSAGDKAAAVDEYRAFCERASAPL